MASRLAPFEPQPIGRRKRKTIPLSVRYAVLCRQAPAEIIERIEREGGKLKDKYAKALLHATCAISGASLIESGCEFDHEIPHALGGDDSAENIQGLSPAAHLRKTSADDARIAKAARQGGATGQHARLERRRASSIQSRGFEKSASTKLMRELIGGLEDMLRRHRDADDETHIPNDDEWVESMVQQARGENN